MARQDGIIKLKGTIADICFYKSQDGYIARQKGGVAGSRIASDPAFARTRENGAEFGRAGKAGKLLRTAIRPMLQNASDSKMVSRLTSEMVKVLHADTINQRGQRNVMDGKLELLEGFEFNILGKLGTTLYAPYTADITRLDGALTVSIPSFVPQNMIAAPEGASHFKIVSAGAEVDFDNNTYKVVAKASDLLPWDATATTAISLANTLSPGSQLPLFLVLGIEFYQEVNGEEYPLKNGSFNALSIVKVSGV
jgi:hypothetical protein